MEELLEECSNRTAAEVASLHPDIRGSFSQFGRAQVPGIPEGVTTQAYRSSDLRDEWFRLLVPSFVHCLLPF